MNYLRQATGNSRKLNFLLLKLINQINVINRQVIEFRIINSLVADKIFGKNKDFMRMIKTDEIMQTS